MIPHEFIINNMKYDVRICDDVDGNLGDYCDVSHQIRLAKSVKSGNNMVNVSEDDMFLTYLHELGHCFGGYYKDDFSEEFACAFSHFMFDYFKSVK